MKKSSKRYQIKHQKTGETHSSNSVYDLCQLMNRLKSKRYKLARKDLVDFAVWSEEFLGRSDWKEHSQLFHSWIFTRLC